MRDGKNARGDGRSRAAGRTSRGVREIPWVSGRTEPPGLGGRRQSQLRTAAFYEDRHSGIEEAPSEGAGMIGNIVLVDARARGRPRALQDIQILQEKRHAGERAIRKPAVDLRLRIVVMFDDYRVDLRINFGRAGNRLVQQLPGGDLLFTD